MTKPSLAGVSHLALTVRDLAMSVDWYVETLGFAPLFAFETEDFARQILLDPSGVVIALTEHRAPLLEAFDPRRAGLDHVGFAVGSVEELHSWAQWLTSRGVTHAGVQITEALGSALVAFVDPDGIALELYVQGALPS